MTPSPGTLGRSPAVVRSGIVATPGHADVRDSTDQEGAAMSSTSVLASGAGSYVHVGVIQISVTNLIIIALMVVVFVLAIILPFPGNQRERESENRP